MSLDESQQGMELDLSSADVITKYKSSVAETSKELLELPSKPSIIEGILLGRNDSANKSQKKRNLSSGYDKGGAFTTEVPKSQVLGRVKDFLGVMAEANQKLELDACGASRQNYDIEVLSDNEQEYIEMDLLLGVADLQTPEAVVAAEAAVGGFQPSVNSISGSSCSDSEDESDEPDTDSEEDDDDSDNDDASVKDHVRKTNLKKRSLHDNKRQSRQNKRPKIVVLN